MKDFGAEETVFQQGIFRSIRRATVCGGKGLDLEDGKSCETSSAEAIYTYFGGYVVVKVACVCRISEFWAEWRLHFVDVGPVNSLEPRMCLKDGMRTERRILANDALALMRSAPSTLRVVLARP